MATEADVSITLLVSTLSRVVQVALNTEVWVRDTLTGRVVSSTKREALSSDEANSTVGTDIVTAMRLFKVGSDGRVTPRENINTGTASADI